VLRNIHKCEYEFDHQRFSLKKLLPFSMKINSNNRNCIIVIILSIVFDSRKETSSNYIVLLISERPRSIKTVSFTIRKQAVNIVKKRSLRLYSVYIQFVFGPYYTVLYPFRKRTVLGRLQSEIARKRTVSTRNVGYSNTAPVSSNIYIDIERMG
jgi:hypothetical protein